MKKRYVTVAALLSLLTFSFTSCKKNVFDEEVYKKILTTEFPIDPVDAQQQWNLTANRVVTINVPMYMVGQNRLMILTDNPSTNPNASIMTESASYINGDNILVFAAPKIQSTFYAAIEQIDGSLLIKSFDLSNLQVSLSDATEISKPANTLGYQTFTYCFEQDYPKPGDYDFNDCVLRISVEPGDKSNQRKINVSMAATGAKIPIAAAIRILNYNYSDIDSVKIEDGKVWDEGYPIRYSLIDNTETLQKGQNGEAVIRLFENASWIMVHNDASDNGQLVNYLVNVNKTVTSTTPQINPTVKTYIVTFKEKSTALLGNFSLLNMDPFIVTNYNGGKWETHIYERKHDNVLFEGVDQDSGHMTWALCIPTGNFRWPYEGNIIGTAKGGLLTGAYRETDHAFGTWAADRNSAQDWYLYPTITEVY